MGTPRGSTWSAKRRTAYFRTYKTLAERFANLFEPDLNGGCWLWTGTLLNTGYGQLEVSGKGVSAHRASYELHCGPIAPGLQVCHRCDVRACVNPSHLFLGTHADNMADMAAKGRAARLRGSEASAAILHERDIPPIRRMIREGVTNRKIGEVFGVSADVINAIRAGRSWRHVPDDTTPATMDRPAPNKAGRLVGA